MNVKHEHTRKPGSERGGVPFFTRPTRSFTPTGRTESPRRQNITGMPDQVLQKMESTFKTDFSNVKIVPNSPKVPQLGALAYTQGHHIHFAPGQFNPGSAEGKKLLAHELTHVIQQRQGIVKPTTRVKGLPVNDDPALEQHADTRGAGSV